MGETNSASVAARLEASRKDLLDLTFRNPLLNYRCLSARGLEITDTSPASVFQMLVKESRKLRFIDTGYNLVVESDQANLDSQLELATLDMGATPGVTNGTTHENFRQNVPTELELQTRHAPADLQKRLLNSYYTAHTFIEEQGINTLFLALGMLQWYEEETSQQKHLSPLVLVPVELERDTAGDRFTVKYREEEPSENASLVALLQNEHGIKFPPFPTPEDLNVDDYFKSVAQLVNHKQRWSVDSSAVAIGFFSFAKLQMYKDLDSASWPDDLQPADNFMLHALLGNGFHDAPSEIRDDIRNLDSIVKVAQSHTVMDADSSQTIAIMDVLSGRNIVIQGPPGTGKSQTITNIIAESLAHGKRILFVAEKMAALDVVKSRLTSLELGDCCLELHSNKSNKKLVLADLQRTLSLGQPDIGTRDDDAILLQDVQDRLNDYANLVNATVGNSRLSVQDVFGEYLASGPSSENPTQKQITLDNCYAWTPIEYKIKESLVGQLQAQLTAMGLPSEHLFWGSERQLCGPVDIDRVRITCTAARAKTMTTRAAVEALAKQLHLKPPTRLLSADVMMKVLRRAIEAPRHDSLKLVMTPWVEGRDEIDALLNHGQKLTTLRTSILNTFRPDALDANVAGLREVIQDLGGKWWRFLSSRWHTSQKTFKSLVLDDAASKLISADAQLRLLEDIVAYQSTKLLFEQKVTLGSEMFGVQWQGEQSNWDVLRTLASWVGDIIIDVRGGKLPKAIFDFLKGNPDLSRFAPELAACEQLIEETRAECSSVLEAIQLKEQVRFGEGEFLATQPFDKLVSLLSSWSASPEKIWDISGYNRLALDCRKAELSPLVDAVESGSISASDLSASFRRSYVWGLVQTAFTLHPALATFSGKSHEQKIHEFQVLDRKHLKNNRAKIARVHWDNLPALQGEGQLRVLRREFEKRSRHLPLRKLVKEAGRVVQAIKPVFMMSPLSVATYIEPAALSFDMVIFDEASQVRPVDAIGALLRGTQAIVVGDSKQLPPTSFFDAVTSGDVVDEENMTADIESILGVFAAQGAPQRMLKWHYRSRHESLIAVSNQEFYDNGLVIFPSPDVARVDYGLHYTYLPDTKYDRGKSGTNREEAKIVAEHVLAHARKQITLPEQEWQSLGVAAFSMAQMQAVLEAVEVLRRQNPECEPFFAPSRHEAFFVKNLENVQGDERDLIYISVGYGRDANGKVSMNFGPLNGEGGARRLNVLITRAKLRCQVFTNLTADDIVLTGTSSHGLKAFKNFLQYAQTGVLAMPVPTGREPDSPFEREVIRILRSMNYDVVPQVGCAGYFIDMAVRDPRQPGRYLIGIECDGRAYHSAKSARDRDRLREQVLRAQGWRLHRIWSTDWIRQPVDEAKRLREAIEQAKAENLPSAQVSAPPLSGTELQLELSGAETVVRVAAVRETKVVPLYVCAELPNAYRISGGYYPPDLIADLAEKVVEVESPVHVLEITRRIAEAAGIGRVSEKLRVATTTAILALQQQHKLQLKSDFCWSPGMTSSPLRNRSAISQSSRKLEIVSPEEIHEAIRYCLEGSYGMNLEELPRAVLRVLLGFERLSQDNRDVILRYVNDLQQKAVVTITNGQVCLSETSTKAGH